MPACPGCKRDLSHDEVLPHLRFCKYVWSDRPDDESKLAEKLATDLHNEALRTVEQK